MFLASWCCSVGATWTVELRPVDGAIQCPPVEWICSGVPTQQPLPDRQTADLLRERDLLLFPVEPVEPVPRTRSRRLIGYVTRDPEVLRLALMLADIVDEGSDHPMVVAARWIEAGYSPPEAARWVAAGVSWPQLAYTMLHTDRDTADSPLWSDPSVPSRGGAFPAARAAPDSAALPAARAAPDSAAPPGDSSSPPRGVPSGRGARGGSTAPPGGGAPLWRQGDPPLSPPVGTATMDS